MLTLRQKHAGFTIVELLIVIVVIAILAAISVVGYNGITTRAENTKSAQAVAKYAQLLKMYAVNNDVYPTNVVPPTAPPADIWTCLPFDGYTTSSTCGTITGASPFCFGLGTGSISATLVSELKKVTSTLPTVSSKVMGCSSTQSYRGAVMRIYNSAKSIDIYFSQIGSVECPDVGERLISRTVNGDVTSCLVRLPSL